MGVPTMLVFLLGYLGHLVAFLLVPLEWLVPSKAFFSFQGVPLLQVVNSISRYQALFTFYKSGKWLCGCFFCFRSVPSVSVLFCLFCVQWSRCNDSYCMASYIGNMIWGNPVPSKQINLIAEIPIVEPVLFGARIKCQFTV